MFRIMSPNGIYYVYDVDAVDYIDKVDDVQYHDDDVEDKIWLRIRFGWGG